MKNAVIPAIAAKTPFVHYGCGKMSRLNTAKNAMLTIAGCVIKSAETKSGAENAGERRQT